ncbi:MAG: ABC transporter ATP-binding protein [Methylobacterium sp.]|nr:ABC transporter ATP-binding protein [Methylobacterium sp.]MCA3604737.1 ABC transporter ATP-binding protein [Methylobacterium sp.]MCA3616423.1 ABC transporter ATP-binding protein [Methylobacterium sp.]MCA4909977.1 ABC transporter ATP-binding protein [Methylobacterium sp.]
MAKAASVEFINVFKLYGNVTAVRDISFRVEAGQLVTLLGPSGCGKTTTLRLVAGLELASQGTIRIGNENVTQLGAAERDVSMVFQSYALFPHMNVLDNVMYGPLVSGASRKAAEAMAIEKLGLVGLRGFEKRLPSELSGGQQQRVAVARAIVLEPSVLLFDEPLSNLDAKLRRKVRDDIRDLQQRLGLTVLYVTHDQEEALAVSDRVIVMDNAVIAEEGTPADLYERPKTRFLADFIGEANLIDGSFSEKAGGVSFTTHGVTLELGTVPVPVNAKTLAFRPDRAGLAVDEASPLAIRRQAYIGSSREYVIDAPWGELLIVRPVREAILPNGTRVRLEIEPGAGMVLPG